MSAERIDVMEWMRQCAPDEVLDAVAELIEAGKHVDAIVWLWRETGTPPHLGQLAQAADTLRAALARVQGEGA